MPGSRPNPMPQQKAVAEPNPRATVLPSPVDLNIDPYTPYVDGVDPYAVNQGDTYDAFIQYLYNSPQYQNGSGLGGKTVAQNLELLKKYEDITGVPFMQLLGDPGGSFAQPEQSKTRQVYGGNPTFDQAFANVDIGQDPISVVNDMVNNPDKYGIDTSKVNVKDSGWQDQMLNVVTDYSYENVAAREANAGKENMYTLPSGDKIKGDPNIWQRKSQYELQGSPDVEKMLTELGASRIPKYDRGAANQKFRVTGEKKPTGSDIPWSVAAPTKDGPGPSQEEEFANYQVMMDQANKDNVPPWERTGPTAAARRPEPMTSKERFSADFAAHNKAVYDKNRAAALAGLGDPNDRFTKAIMAGAMPAIQRAQGTMVASDAERALVMKLLAARMLAG